MFDLQDYPAAALEWFHEAPVFWPSAVVAAIDGGIRDENDLTDLPFYMHHPERMSGSQGRPLVPGEPGFATLVDEWVGFRHLVRQMLADPDAPTPRDRPGPGACRAFVPTRSDTLVVGGRELRPPAGLVVTNWSDPGVARKDRSGSRSRPACRAVGDVREIIVHETASQRVSRRSAGRPNVHLVLHRDGTFTQHADLVHDLNHANHHNRASFGFETVNPVVPRLAGAPQNGLPRDRVRWPTLRDTSWAGLDRHDPDRRRVRNPVTGEREVVNGPLPRESWNASRHYVRPTHEQLEAATALIRWTTDGTVGHGMDVPRTWRGLRRRGELLLFGRDDRHFARREPGIYAHGYFHHSDGYFVVLYALLRLERGLASADALARAEDLARHHTVRHREPGGHRRWHADLTA